MENTTDKIEVKKVGRPKKDAVEKPKGKRGRPSMEEIRKKYMTRKRGRPTKEESAKPRYVSVKDRKTE